MKNMKKFASLGLSLVMMLSLAACGSAPIPLRPLALLYPLVPPTAPLPPLRAMWILRQEQGQAGRRYHRFRSHGLQGQGRQVDRLRC